MAPPVGIRIAGTRIAGTRISVSGFTCVNAARRPSRLLRAALAGVGIIALLTFVAASHPGQSNSADASGPAQVLDLAAGGLTPQNDLQTLASRVTPLRAGYSENSRNDIQLVDDDDDQAQQDLLQSEQEDDEAEQQAEEQNEAAEQQAQQDEAQGQLDEQQAGN
jgi:hypothetical protein